MNLVIINLMFVTVKLLLWQFFVMNIGLYVFEMTGSDSLSAAIWSIGSFSTWMIFDYEMNRRKKHEKK